MEAHDLHQHLVGVGGAVEGAGAGAVIGRGFGSQELGARRLAFRKQLADLRLVVIGEPGRHRPRWQEHRGQMAERQRADEQSGHDLVADAEIDRSVEHIVRKRDRGRKRDHVAREERQIHALFALGDAVAHRRHPAGDLRRAACRPRRLLDQVGKALERLMGGQHVVVGGDDREIGARPLAQGLLVAGPAGGEAVGEISAAEALADRPLGDRGLDPIEIGPARVPASPGDPIGRFADARVESGHRLKPPSCNGGGQELAGAILVALYAPTASPGLNSRPGLGQSW